MHKSVTMPRYYVSDSSYDPEAGIQVFMSSHTNYSDAMSWFREILNKHVLKYLQINLKANGSSIEEDTHNLTKYVGTEGGLSVNTRQFDQRLTVTLNMPTFAFVIKMIEIM